MSATQAVGGPSTLAGGAAASNGGARPPKVVARDAFIGYRTKTEPGYLVAVDDLNLEIGDGLFASIVGRSGCGKSTFLHALHGLHPLASGVIEVDGVPVSGPSTDRSLVFQHPALFPWKSVQANIEYGLRLQGRIDSAAQERVAGLIELVGLQGFEQSYPHELSGGMRQRANLARALAVDPTLLLLDEPFGALDALTRSRMQDELQRIWQEDKPAGGAVSTARTAIFITHDIQEAVYLSDVVFVMTPRPGRLRARFDIALDRPRDAAIRRSQEFLNYCDAITEAIYA
jgi:NitT/TauT family transport system ATP-binding protein